MQNVSSLPAGCGFGTIDAPQRRYLRAPKKDAAGSFGGSYFVVSASREVVRLAKKFLCVVTILLIVLSCVAFAQTLHNLTHQPPAQVGMPFQLTDGTVMFQGNSSATWYKLT